MSQCSARLARVRGLFLMSLSSLGFTIQGGFVHFFGSSICAMEQMAMRGTGAWLLVMFALSFSIGRPSRKWFGSSDIPQWLILRSVAGAISSSLAYLALSASNSVGDAAALIQTQPLFATLYGVVLLGEKPSKSACLALLFGFGGALLIAKPSFLGLAPEVEGLDEAARQRSVLYAIGCGMCGGMVFVALRRTRQEHFLAVMNWQMMAECIFGLVIAEATCDLRWNFAPWQWPILASYGVCAFGAQLCMTLGARLQNVAAGSGVRMLDVLFSYTLQLLFFPKDALDATSLLGSCLIVCGVVAIVAEQIFRAPPVESLGQEVPTAADIEVDIGADSSAEGALEQGQKGLPGAAPKLSQQIKSAIRGDKPAKVASEEEIRLQFLKVDVEVIGREEQELGA
mmetsp:Transcript_13032/g.30451  ORF Transcript_13032/g.30451 Transcript_13032/m.30451 type:complete len:398 (+) Transcript_13032:68-1261(+)